MRRFAHFMRHNKGGELPHLAMWTDTETQPRDIGPNLVSHHLTFGWGVFQRRARGKRWTPPTWQRYTTPEAFWAWATEHTRPRTQLFLFAHNWSFDAPVLRTFEILPAQGWQLTRAVIQCPPVILKWRRDDSTITMLDTLNWWRCSLKALGESIGVPKLDMPAAGASRKAWDAYCRQDTEIIRQAMHHWWRVLDSYDLGGFANTVAGQSLRAYRHRYLNVPILIDSCDEALDLARQSLHGGRTEIFRQGKVTGPIYALDVNAMYPHVMRERPYPTILKSHMRHVTLADLYRWLASYAVIAEVSIETQTPDYGHVHQDKLCFPIGRLRTCLTTPDLIYAFKAGHLKQVHRCAIYDWEHIFTGFVDEIYALRTKAKADGNDVHSELLKKVMNALYGKFAQRGQVWEVVTHTEDPEIKVWDEFDYDTGHVDSLRQFAGAIQVLLDKPEAPDSHPAIAAHVTAYARAELRRLIALAGPRNVLYCDTDSLYVTQTGRQRLASEINPDRLGALKQEAIYDWIKIHGPKDYATPTHRVCKGVRSKAEWLDANTVRQERWSTLTGLVRTGNLSAPTTLKQIKRLERIYSKGNVNSLGIVTPLRLADW